jgi:protein SCO1
MGSHAVRLALALVVLMGPARCQAPPQVRAEYDVRGTIRSVDPANGALVIDHDEVPGYMQPMVMSFPVSDPALLDGLRPGDAIVFHLLVLPPGEGLLINAIEPVDE